MSTSPPSSSSHHRSVTTRFLFPLVIFLLSSLVINGALASDTAAIKGVSPGEPTLNITVTSCERIQVSGYSRNKLEKYATSFRVNLAPLKTLPEGLHGKIQVCVHRNASRSMCQCAKSDWRNLHKGIWNSVMSPYGNQYIDVRFNTESSSGSFTIYVVEEFHRWRVLCLVTGLVLILVAPVVSRWLPFYYTSSMAVGVFLVLIIIMYQVMRLLPTGRKNVMYLALYGSVVGAGSFILHHFSMMVNMILVNFGLSEDMYNPVVLLVLVGIVITGAAFGFWTVRRFVISKEDGGVDASVAQFVKWAMRSVAATFILQSSLDTPLAMGAFVAASLLGFLFSTGSKKIRSRDMRRRVVVQSPMHGRAEFLSRSGGGLWNSARRSGPSSPFVSPSNGFRQVITPFSAYERTPIAQQDYYSTYHRTPNRKKLSKREYEELTQETTREAMAGLAASPGFSDWLIEHADRIKLLPTENDDEFGSESDSTGEQSWTGLFW